MHVITEDPDRYLYPADLALINQQIVRSTAQLRRGLRSALREDPVSFCGGRNAGSRDGGERPSGGNRALVFTTLHTNKRWKRLTASLMSFPEAVNTVDSNDTVDDAQSGALSTVCCRERAAAGVLIPAGNDAPNTSYLCRA